MQVELKSGEYTIVCSGQAFLFDKDDELLMTIKYDDNIEIPMVIKFIKDDLGMQKLEKEVQDGVISLLFYNLADIGAGMYVPAKLACIDGKDVYVSIWSYLKGEEGKQIRQVDYTIYEK